MGFYLLDHPPAVQQFYPTRRNPLSGGVLVHTTESIMDDVGPDTGAENVAAYIARRTEFGSYHVIVDSDSAVALMPDSYTAFHCEVKDFNSRTWAISFACKTSDLDVNAEWTKRAMLQASEQIYGFWKRNDFDVQDSAAFIAAGDTLNTAGLTTHGDAQPYNRSDAWTRHPQRPQLESMLVDNILSFVDPVPPSPGGEPVKPEMLRDPRDGTIWLAYPGTPWRTHVKTQQDIKTYQFFGVPYKGDMAPDFRDFFLRNTQWVKTG
jgi:hypothetical protein